MHDGSIPTLEDVADYYDRGGNANPNLDEDLHPLPSDDGRKGCFGGFLRSLSGNVLEVKR
jgi:cytochrome c peroxidase